MIFMENKSRLKWACRRGMLELDVLFAPFIDDAYDLLTKDKQIVFQQLLSCEDPDLFAWFMGHEECADPDMNAMVKFILSSVKPKPRA